jgi:hypothetical protein
VLENEGDLIGEEPDVDGVQDRADHRDGVVQFQVTVSVPRERGDPIARADPERAQGVRELRDAPPEIGIAQAHDRGTVARDDLFAGMIAQRVFEDRANRERLIGHRRRDRPAGRRREQRRHPKEFTRPPAHPYRTIERSASSSSGCRKR